MIRSVIFDIDNTMYNYDQANETAMEALLQYGASRLSVDPSRLKEAVSREHRDITLRLGTNSSAIHNRLIRFQNVLEKSGADLSEALQMYHVYWDTLIENMKPEPGLREFISALVKAGISVGVGTDMTAYIQFKKLEKLQILRNISYIVTSEEAGAEKPSPEFFRLCVKKSGHTPEECVFIGDSLKKDIRGARENGLGSLWYCPDKTREKRKDGPVLLSFTELVSEGRLRREALEELCLRKN